MVNSFSNGQGESAFHGLLRYAAKRDESKAAGFAELKVSCQRLHPKSYTVRSLPRYGVINIREGCGQLLDQMWSVTGLLQLLDDTDDDVIMDAVLVHSSIYCRAG